MTPPAHLGRRARWRSPNRLVAARRRPGGLPDRLGEGHQIVDAGRRGIELPFVADQIPATRGRQPDGVPLAQVVGVGLGEDGEGADHRGGVRVDISQCGYGRLRASVAGTAPG